MASPSLTRTMLAVAGVFLLTSCSAAQLARFIEWHQQDPTAAEAYANQPEVQQQLADAAATPPATVAAPAPTVWDGDWTANWDSVAACESGGNWSHPPVTNSTGTYSGGLMWSQRYWPIYGGDFAPWAYQATKAEQIAAAERLVEGSYAEADRAWDCL